MAELHGFSLRGFAVLSDARYHAWMSSGMEITHLVEQSVTGVVRGVSQNESLSILSTQLTEIAAMILEPINFVPGGSALSSRVFACINDFSNAVMLTVLRVHNSVKCFFSPFIGAARELVRLGDAISSVAVVYLSIRELKAQCQAYCSPQFNITLVPSRSEEQVSSAKETIAEALNEVRTGASAIPGDRVFFVDLDGSEVFKQQVWVKKNDLGCECCYVDSKLGLQLIDSCMSKSQIKGTIASSLSASTKAKHMLNALSLFTVVTRNCLQFIPVPAFFSSTALLSVMPLAVQESAASLAGLAARVAYVTSPVIALFTAGSLVSLVFRYAANQALDAQNLKLELSHYNDEELAHIQTSYQKQLDAQKNRRKESYQEYRNASVVLHNAGECVRIAREACRVLHLNKLPTTLYNFAATSREKKSLAWSVLDPRPALGSLERDFRQIPEDFSLRMKELIAVNALLSSYYINEDGREWLVDWGAGSGFMRCNTARDVLAQRTTRV